MSDKTKASFFWRVVVPAIILQSVWIGGGFGTGREIVEFIVKHGVYGIASIIVAAITLIIALIPSYEIARRYRTFDYYSWSKVFLGKAWIALDISYIVLAWIVIAVVAAAAAHIIEDLTGIPFIVGAAIMIAIVGILHFFGRKAMESFWIIGTVGLYAMYVVIWVLTLSTYGGKALANISAGLSQTSLTDAIIDGFRYTLYNLCVVIPVLSHLDRLKDTKDSVISTLIGAALVYGAALIIWICFMAFYPDIIEWPVPWYEVLKRISPWALGLYVFWIFYTLVETGLGMVHGIVRRIDAQLRTRGKQLTKLHEAIIAAIILTIALITSQVGIIALVAKGYGTMAWVFFAVYFLPIITIGVYRIRQKPV